ncbi:hypothetical protein AYO38_07320 [bacterium SCGC AG-212-C10]|nr:hypothetical protein AYO38_07320 [bacterium SCGC AG-212-C10]
MQQAAVAIIFIATVIGLYVRPFGARDWQVALAGAAAAWLAGPLSVADGLRVIGDSWNIVLFFAGLMLLAAGAEATGLYASAERVFARADSPRQMTLFVLVGGIAITAILSNDATPLVFTPAVFAASRSRGFPVRGPAFATTFVADGASLLLPVSNPVNLLFFERFDYTMGDYAHQVFPAAIAGTAALAAVAYLLPSGGDDPRPAPRSVVREAANPVLQRWAIALIVVLAPVYVLAAANGWPLGVVSVGGGVALFLAQLAFGGVRRDCYRRQFAPSLFVFVASLLVLVAAVSEAGLLDGLGARLESLGGQQVFFAVLGAALIATVIANLVNNWPAALLLTTAIAGLAAPSEAVLTGTLIGCTIGANLSMTGSLSTVFWLSLARAEGVHYSAIDYARRAFLPTTAGLLAAVGAASLCLR